MLSSAWAIGLSGVAILAGGDSANEQRQAQVFRGRLDLVRTEVAVIDNRTGRPVDGLTQADFSILENGTRQAIASFARLDEAGASSENPAPNDRRVFLLVFGLGGLFDGPIKPFDGAVEFLRKRLRSSDLAAVMVWNRVTALTTDHERLVSVVERIRSIPTDVFVAAQRDAQRLIDLAPQTQSAIDAWFDPLAGSDGFLRSATALLLGTDRYRTMDDVGVPWNRRVAGRDLLKVHAGIEYLRHVEGRKHVVLLSTYGLSPPWKLVDPEAFHASAEDDRRLVAQANDAGVALDIIHTIGTFAAGPGTLGANFATMSSQQIASGSGGQFTSIRTAAEQFDRLDAATRSGYLLGYIPADPNLDGKYRTVDIRVNRRNVTVVYRRGYTARADPPSINPRELMARIRLREAAATTIRLDDIRVIAKAAAVGTTSAREVRVELSIDPTSLALSQANARWTGSIDLMVLCADEKDRPVGVIEQRMDLNMSQALYDKAASNGIPYTIDVPITAVAKRVKAVVYNYDTDRLGGAIVQVK